MQYLRDQIQSQISHGSTYEAARLWRISPNSVWMRGDIYCPNELLHWSKKSLIIYSFVESISLGRITCFNTLKVIWARRKRGSSCPVLSQCARKRLAAEPSCRFILTSILTHVLTVVITTTVIKPFVPIMLWRNICSYTVRKSCFSALR